MLNYCVETIGEEKPQVYFVIFNMMHIFSGIWNNFTKNGW